MEEYNKYIMLKQLFKAKFKGYKLNKLLAIIFISDCYGHIKMSEPTIKEIVKSFFYVENYRNLKNVLSHNGVILSQAKWKRNDYRELVYLMGSSMKGSLIFDYEFNKVKKLRINIILVSIIQVVFYLRKEYSFRQLLFLATKITEIKYKLIEVDKYAKKAKIKGFIAFNSSIFDDALLCSVLKRYGIDTFSLQHGYYSIYNNKIPLDIINYENLIADKLLCWGQSTYENMLSFGIKENRLTVLGNPRIKFSEKFNLIETNFKRCLVLLGRDIYHESNIKLLEIISEINKISGEEFLLKLHPTLRVKKLENKYSGKFKIIKDVISVKEALNLYNCDMAFSNNTSAFFDALIQGVICFRFTKYENEDFGETIFKFEDVNDYYKLKEYILSKSTRSIENIVFDSLKYNFCDNFTKNIYKLNSNLLLK
jgi:hypothetical protein